MRFAATVAPGPRRSAPLSVGILVAACLCALGGGLGLAYLTQIPRGAVESRLGVDPYAILLCVALSVFALGGYLAWPSRWNIPAHLQIGFCATAYVIPTFIEQTTAAFPGSLVRRYAVMVTVGAAAYVFGILIGKFAVRTAPRLPLNFASWPEPILTEAVGRRTLHWLIAASAGLVLAFVLIGFVPLFTPDPLAAKYFRGAYQGSYAPYALLFRSSLYIVAALVPLALALWYVGRRGRYLTIALVALFAMAGTLLRGTVATGLFMFAGIVAARSRPRALAFIVFLVVAFPLGSAVYYLTAPLLHISFGGQSTAPDIFAAIANGAPDIRDQLQLLQQFSFFGSFTHGLTFVGGLVPGHYRWNPAVWTLGLVAPGTDVNATGSGGLRLSPALWGYTAFGWTGVVLVPLVSGVLMAVVTAIFRPFIGGSSVTRSTVALLLYASLGLQLAEFYTLSIYTAPAVAALLAITLDRGFPKNHPALRGSSTDGVVDR